MGLKGHLILFFLWIALSIKAQHVQWASEVVAFSSQYSNKDWSAEQALGVPNALGNLELYRLAWSPKKEENAVNEYIRVRFEEPMRIQQVAVAESAGPGAIHKIYAFDKNGKKHLLYENKSPRPIGIPQRLFRYKCSRTDFYVQDIRVELKTKAVKGPNQIDAIAISNSKEDIKLKVEEAVFETSLGAIENLGPDINSEYAERLPIISPDGQTLFFARKYHPQNIGEDNMDDIWVSRRMANGQWSRAVNVGAPLNNKTHNFVIATNPTGNILYLANDYNSKAKDGVSQSKRRGRTWSRPRTLEIKNHYNDNIFVGYHINMEGNVLLMAVERDDSRGDRDLYISFKAADGEWTEPRSLGATINTVGRESSVFLAADNKTIYFSSDGHQGYGGLDMYMSKRLDNSWTKWSKPLNLGKQINSIGNDYNYTIPASGEYAYFSRDNNNGMSDIYRIKLPEEVRPEPVILLVGNIIDAETQTPVNGKIKYQRLTRKNEKAELTPLEDGSFQVVLPYGNHVGIHAEVEGYFAVAEHMELGEDWLEEEDFDTKIQPSANMETIQKLEEQLSELNEELEYLSSEQEPEFTRKGVDVEREEDDELRRMKEKFNKRTESIGAPRMTKKGQGQSNDAELEALKRKFMNHNATAKGIEKTKTEREKDEDKLAALKERFNRHHGKDQETGQEVEPLEVAEEDQERLQAFEQLRRDVRMELESQIAPQLTFELREELIEEVRPEVEESTGKGMSEAQKEALNDEVEAQLRDELEEDVRSSLREKREIEEEEADDLDEIEEGLKTIMEEEVRAELTETLREPMKEKIRREMEYRVKKELEVQLKTELEAERAKLTTTEIPVITEVPTKEIPQKEEREYRKVEKDILVVPIKVGQIIPMNNVFFDANQSSLKEVSFAELDRVVAFLEQNSNLIVEVGGHTNGWCSHEFASELSRNRAASVTDYFKSKGISENHIQFKGYGKTNPIADNNTLSGRKKNQRVELKILEILD